MSEVVKTDTIISNDEVIFFDTNEDKYVKAVDEFNTPTDFTRDFEDALAMPNTLNFKNSRKYVTLIEKSNITPINRIERKTYDITLEEL